VRFLTTSGNEYNVNPTAKNIHIENSIETKITNSWNSEEEKSENSYSNNHIILSNGQEEEIKEKERINIESFGLKIMLQQGYKEGQGLGRNNNGIVSPIDVEFKVDTLGLGYH